MDHYQQRLTPKEGVMIREIREHPETKNAIKTICHRLLRITTMPERGLVVTIADQDVRRLIALESAQISKILGGSTEQVQKVVEDELKAEVMRRIHSRVADLFSK